VTELLAIFATGFVSVFALGFQSRNVNNGNYGWAAGTSFFVGLSQASLWTHITSPSASKLDWFVYALSGACAITLSMYVHERFIRKGDKSAPTIPRELPSPREP
jgi:hypothetical protein